MSSQNTTPPLGRLHRVGYSGSYYLQVPRLTLSLRLSPWSCICVSKFEQIRHEAEHITRDLSPVGWHHAPPGKWSCTQIFEHLLLTYTTTTKGTLKALQMGKPLRGKPNCAIASAPFMWRDWGFCHLDVRPQYKQPQRTAQAWSRYASSMTRWWPWMPRCRCRAPLWQARQLLNHPFLGPLNAQEWRLFHRTHTRHHLKQWQIARSTHVSLAGECPNA